MSIEKDSEYMKIALSFAKRSAEEGEIPVGAVVVYDNGDEEKIISKGRNRREKKKNALLHAEMEAIDRACKKLGGWRLDKCTLYVTLEPCVMCYGAIVNSRIKRVVFGTYDKRFGVLGSMTDLSALPFNHKPDISGGVLERECSEILKCFFKDLRNDKQLSKEVK